MIQARRAKLILEIRGEIMLQYNEAQTLEIKSKTPYLLRSQQKVHIISGLCAADNCSLSVLGEQHVDKNFFMFVFYEPVNQKERY